MKSLGYWVRWVAVIPLVGVVYFLVQAYLVGFVLPIVRAYVIEDPSGTSDITSHLAWDFILFPLFCLMVGAVCGYEAVRTSRAIAPSHKTEIGHVIAGMVILLAISNVALSLLSIGGNPATRTIMAITVNIAAGVGAVYEAFAQGTLQKYSGSG